MGDVSFGEDNYEGSSISHTLAHNRGGCADRHVVGLAEGSAHLRDSKTQFFTLQTRMLKLREWKGLGHSHTSLGRAKVRTQSSEPPLQILSTISYDEQFGEIKQPRGNKERSTSH